MMLEHPRFLIEFFPHDACERIEMYGRTCYKSEDRITKGSAERFVKMIMRRGHLSVIEHVYATVRIIADRGLSHELVRHRLASYSQESTRYCDYSGELSIIEPPFDWPEPHRNRWLAHMQACEVAYKDLRALGAPPEQARQVLPISTKTEIVMTSNFREWLHVFELRTSPRAHPVIRKLMTKLQEDFATRCPPVFGGSAREL